MNLFIEYLPAIYLALLPVFLGCLFVAFRSSELHAGKLGDAKLEKEENQQPIVALRKAIFQDVFPERKLSGSSNIPEVIGLDMSPPTVTGNWQWIDLPMPESSERDRFFYYDSTTRNPTLIETTQRIIRTPYLRRVSWQKKVNQRRNHKQSSRVARNSPPSMRTIFNLSGVNLT